MLCELDFAVNDSGTVIVRGSTMRSGENHASVCDDHQETVLDKPLSSQGRIYRAGPASEF
jgi:hypothetical protein